MKKLKVAWFSAGVSSFIATYLVKDTIDKIIYIDIDDQHSDSIRFVKECEKILGKKIEILKSNYKDVETAVQMKGVIRMAKGYAPCTDYLKKRVRFEWELKQVGNDITYVWGMDCDEKKRAKRLEEKAPNATHEFPLIANNLTKQDCHAMSRKLGVQRPRMYDLGYNNNNCIGCVKGGMGYWNKIRKDFPEVFKSRAKLERVMNCRCLKECYLDELDPKRGDMSKEILDDCGIFCEYVYNNDNT